MTTDERDAFERAMGRPPEHCIRVGDGYASTEYNAWRAHDYVQQWSGWKARAAIAALDAEPSLEDVLRDGPWITTLSYANGSWTASVRRAGCPPAGWAYFGTGATTDEAIRNAVKAAGGES